MKRKAKQEPTAATAEWVGKSLPANDRIERAAIAGLLMLNLGGLSQTRLTSEHFFTPANLIVFQAIARAEADGQPFDVVTITQAIHEDGQLDSIGGAPFIERLLTDPAHGNASNMLAEYERELERVRQERGMWRVLDQAQTALRTVGTNPEQLAGDVRTGIDRVFEGASGDESVTGKSLEAAMAHLERVQKREGKPLGIYVGVPCYDKELGGVHEGIMDVIGARPKVGKTSMLETMLDTMLEQKMAVDVFQKDMSTVLMVERMACRRARVVFEDFYYGTLPDGPLHRVRQELKRLASLQHLLRIYDPSRLTARQIDTIVRRDRDRHGLRAWFLDHFQTLQHETAETRVEGLTESSLILRNLITTSKVPGVIVAQISKEADKTTRPHAGQFKYCDQLFSDADRIVLLWSLTDPKTLDPDERQVIKFTVDANRIGPVSENELHFHRELMTFEAAI